jgi:hypothetical protein
LLEWTQATVRLIGCRFLHLLSSRKINIDTYFLSPLELNHAPLMNDQLNRSISDRAERLLQFPEEHGRQVERMKPETRL